MQWSNEYLWILAAVWLFVHAKYLDYINKVNFENENAWGFYIEGKQSL